MLHIGIVLAMVNVNSNCRALQLEVFCFDQQLVVYYPVASGVEWLPGSSPELMPWLLMVPFLPWYISWVAGGGGVLMQPA